MEEFAPKLENLVKRFSNDAADVERTETVPSGHFDAIAAAGLYGCFAPVSDGGLGLELVELSAVVEELAAACLATTFVWIQHFRLLAAVTNPEAPAPVRDLLPRVVSGEIRGGIFLGGQLPGPSKLTATRSDDGWSLNGEANWVSGWGLVEVLVVAARGPDDTVVTVIIDAVERPGLTVTPRRLSAINATATVTLDFDNYAVNGDRFVSQVPFDPTQEGPEGLRINGSLALGVIRRCCAWLGITALDDELDAARQELDAADVTNMFIARARACELAVRASHALTVERGSSSILDGDIADRTTREASLLLAFGSRLAIRQALLERFGIV
jgi:alkylation response protein AidB-like acyl-CoA dehydrogenase